MIEAKSLTLENTVIVGIINIRQDETQSKEYLDELAFLAYTAGGVVLKRFIQKMRIPNPKTFIGSGKMSEVEHFVSKNVNKNDSANNAKKQILRSYTAGN